MGLSFSGEFRSLNKWSGYDIQDFKEYQPGDNIKAINWKLSAKYDKEFVNVYYQEQDVIFDVYLDNNLNLEFFDTEFQKFTKYFLHLKYELGFKFRVFAFDSNLKLIAENTFPSLKFNSQNDLNKIFDFADFKKPYPKIIISDLFFLDKFQFSNKVYFGLLPVNIFKNKKFPTWNGYYGLCNDFWEKYDKKIEFLKKYGVLEWIR